MTYLLFSISAYYDTHYPPSIDRNATHLISSPLQMQNSPWSSTAVPSRPAPAPPPPSIAANSTHRYTPTTNWDDSPFDTAESHQSRKVPPPRPPPPRVQPSPVESTWSNNNGAKSKVLGIPFKKATPQSVNILSNLFGSRSGGSSSGSKTQGLKLPPPPPTLKKQHHHTNVQVSIIILFDMKSIAY